MRHYVAMATARSACSIWHEAYMCVCVPSVSRAPVHRGRQPWALFYSRLSTGGGCAVKRRKFLAKQACSSSEVSDSPVAIRGPASAERRSSSRTFWGVLRACKTRSRLRQRRKMAWHRQLPAGRPAPFRSSAAAGSTAQAVSRLLD
eukprot:scaffold3520_cov154-Isochrysis_galbana.AAC.3